MVHLTVRWIAAREVQRSWKHRSAEDLHRRLDPAAGGSGHGGFGRGWSRRGCQGSGGSGHRSESERHRPSVALVDAGGAPPMARRGPRRVMKAGDHLVGAGE